MVKVVIIVVVVIVVIIVIVLVITALYVLSSTLHLLCKTKKKSFFWKDSLSSIPSISFQMLIEESLVSSVTLRFSSYVKELGSSPLQQ